VGFFFWWLTTKKKSLGFGVPKGVVSTTHSQRGREPALLHSVLHKKMYKKNPKRPTNQKPKSNQEQKSKIKKFSAISLTALSISTLCFFKYITFSPSRALRLWVSLSPQLSLSLPLKESKGEKKRNEHVGEEEEEQQEDGDDVS
jgi:hypothetical protein